MGQATLDLPDPLLNANPADAQNVNVQSADDLLSQLAGDEIDRLLAENDEPPAAQPVPAAAIDPSQNLDQVLAEAAADRNAADERSALHDELPAVPAAILPDLSPKIELGDNAAKLPLLFRPLEWLSAPLDPWPDQLRELMGKAGLLTLINAIAVLAYVMWRRHHP